MHERAAPPVVPRLHAGVSVVQQAVDGAALQVRAHALRQRLGRAGGGRRERDTRQPDLLPALDDETGGGRLAHARAPRHHRHRPAQRQLHRRALLLRKHRPRVPRQHGVQHLARLRLRRHALAQVRPLRRSQQQPQPHCHLPLRLEHLAQVVVRRSLHVHHRQGACAQQLPHLRLHHRRLERALGRLCRALARPLCVHRGLQHPVLLHHARHAHRLFRRRSREQKTDRLFDELRLRHAAVPALLAQRLHRVHDARLHAVRVVHAHPQPQRDAVRSAKAHSLEVPHERVRRRGDHLLRLRPVLGPHARRQRRRQPQALQLRRRVARGRHALPALDQPRGRLGAEAANLCNGIDVAPIQHVLQLTTQRVHQRLDARRAHALHARQQHLVHAICRSCFRD
mmetsp:Transcript_22811/g.73405  ORF Transcript_22811/g.73405 Transcript_22811/m.73405 type:complete len:397 (-) Transcript_22811:374-1564(-)